MQVTVIGLKPSLQARLRAACPRVRLKTFGPEVRPAQISGVGVVVLLTRFLSHGLQEAVLHRHRREDVHLHRGCVTGLAELVRRLAT